MKLNDIKLVNDYMKYESHSKHFNINNNIVL